MQLPDKINALRKSKAMSQEELAEKLGVSRQAVSRWETGVATPDAANILQISKLFGVTTDYLLNDEHQDNGAAEKKEIEHGATQRTLIVLITLEAVALMLQFACFVILQNDLFGILSMIPFVAAVGGFEYTYRKNARRGDTENILARKLFYKASVWLGAYFPVRYIIQASLWLYPRPYNSLVVEAFIVVIYLAVAALMTLLIEKTVR